MKPVYVAERDDSDMLKKKILEISYADWKKQGSSKGTLHQLKLKANSDKPFTLNSYIRARLGKWEHKIVNRYAVEV